MADGNQSRSMRLLPFTAATQPERPLSSARLAAQDGLLRSMRDGAVAALLLRGSLRSQWCQMAMERVAEYCARCPKSRNEPLKHGYRVLGRLSVR
jgi:hypothetical protein